MVCLTHRVSGRSAVARFLAECCLKNVLMKFLSVSVLVKCCPCPLQHVATAVTEGSHKPLHLHDKQYRYLHLMAAPRSIRALARQYSEKVQSRRRSENVARPNADAAEDMMPSTARRVDAQLFTTSGPSGSVTRGSSASGHSRRHARQLIAR